MSDSAFNYFFDQCENATREQALDAWNSFDAPTKEQWCLAAKEANAIIEPPKHDFVMPELPDIKRTAPDENVKAVKRSPSKGKSFNKEAFDGVSEDDVLTCNGISAEMILAATAGTTYKGTNATQYFAVAYACVMNDGHSIAVQLMNQLWKNLAENAKEAYKKIRETVNKAKPKSPAKNTPAKNTPTTLKKDGTPKKVNGWNTVVKHGKKFGLGGNMTGLADLWKSIKDSINLTGLSEDDATNVILEALADHRVDLNNNA